MKTERQIINDFLNLMGVIVENPTPNIITGDFEITSNRITSVGYDEVRFGFQFNKDDYLVKGFIDSHVTYESKNSEDIYKSIEEKI